MKSELTCLTHVFLQHNIRWPDVRLGDGSASKAVTVGGDEGGEIVLGEDPEVDRLRHEIFHPNLVWFEKKEGLCALKLKEKNPQKLILIVDLKPPRSRPSSCM